MKRHPPFEPPEYLNWQPDDTLLGEFRATLDKDPKRAAVIRRLSPVQLLDMYSGLVRNRLADIGLKRLVRQGVISKAWLGTGEEAATIGPVHALRRPRAATTPAARETCDVVAPMIRNAGACLEMGMSVADMLRAYMGTIDGPTRGRDGHYGDLANGVLAPISHVGDVVPVVAGIAMSFQARGTDRVAMTWIGDGSVKAGVAHEGLNFAAVQQAAGHLHHPEQPGGARHAARPAPSRGQAKLRQWAARRTACGGACFDGNNVLDAYAATRSRWTGAARGEGPALLVAETFRMGGHATHDEAEARETFDASLFEYWGKRDPIAAMFEEHLVRTGISRERLAEAERAVEAEVDAAELEALASRAEHMPAGPSALSGVYRGMNGHEACVADAGRVWDGGHRHRVFGAVVGARRSRRSRRRTRCNRASRLPAGFSVDVLRERAARACGSWPWRPTDRCTRASRATTRWCGSPTRTATAWPTRWWRR